MRLFAQSCPTLCSPQAPPSMGFSSKNTGMGCLSLLQGIFPTQRLKPSLLHWQADSLPLSQVLLCPFVQSLWSLTLCDPMDCSMPGFPVSYHLPELLKLMSIELVMPSNHLILCGPLPLLLSITSGSKCYASNLPPGGDSTTHLPPLISCSQVPWEASWKGSYLSFLLRS